MGKGWLYNLQYETLTIYRPASRSPPPQNPQPSRLITYSPTVISPQHLLFLPPPMLLFPPPPPLLSYTFSVPLPLASSSPLSLPNTQLKRSLYSTSQKACMIRETQASQTPQMKKNRKEKQETLLSKRNQYPISPSPLTSKNLSHTTLMIVLPA